MVDNHKPIGPNKDLRFPDWQAQFNAARIETDPEKLLQSVKEAEAAIFQRQQVLVEGIPHDGEQQAIADALRILRDIQTQKLGYPDWEK